MLNKMYKLPEISFVGGTSEEFRFDVFHDESNPQPFGLFGGTVNFSIVNIVNKNGTPLVSKAMEIVKSDDGVDFNVLRVSLEPTDTVDLFGKFVYQITIKDVDGNVDIPHQGIINISKNINRAFIRGN